jgi:hypothetical protein
MKEPEAITFIELLADMSKQVDRNSQKKQHVTAQEKDKEREQFPGTISINSCVGLDTHSLSVRRLAETSSASAISSTRASEKR